MSVLKIKIQIMCGDEIAMGPGKAALLDAIECHGSISAAARAIGMSYRRAWLLVDVMNRCWSSAIVSTAAGGSRGGGAQVTPFGRAILAQYLGIVALAAGAEDSDCWRELDSALLAQPRPSL